MGRRTKHASGNKARTARGAESAPQRQETETRGTASRAPSRTNQWLLAAAVLLTVAWLAFLAVMPFVR